MPQINDCICGCGCVGPTISQTDEIKAHPDLTKPNLTLSSLGPQSNFTPHSFLSIFIFKATKSNEGKIYTQI